MERKRERWSRNVTSQNWFYLHVIDFHVGTCCIMLEFLFHRSWRRTCHQSSVQYWNKRWTESSSTSMRMATDWRRAFWKNPSNYNHSNMPSHSTRKLLIRSSKHLSTLRQLKVIFILLWSFFSYHFSCSPPIILCHDLREMENKEGIFNAVTALRPNLLHSVTEHTRKTWFSQFINTPYLNGDGQQDSLLILDAMQMRKFISP